MEDIKALIIPALSIVGASITAFIASGRFSFELWLMIGVTVIFITVLTYLFLKRRKEKLMIDEVPPVLEPNVIETPKNTLEEKGLEEHRFFDEVRNYIDSLLFLYFKGEREKELVKYKRYILVIFLFQKYKTFYINTLRFIESDEIKECIIDDDINCNLQEINPNLQKWIEEYKSKAKLKGVPEIFIRLFENWNRKEINSLMKRNTMLKGMKSLRYDRERISVMLMFLLFCLETTAENIKEVEELNGKYEKAIQEMDETNILMEYNSTEQEIREFLSLSNEELLNKYIKDSYNGK